MIIKDEEKEDYKRIIKGEIGPSKLTVKEVVTMIHTIHNRQDHKDIKSDIKNPNEYHTLKYEKQNYILDQKQEEMLDSALSKVNEYPNQNYLGWDKSSTSIQSNQYYTWKAEEQIGQHYYYSAMSNSISKTVDSSKNQQQSQNQSSLQECITEPLKDSEDESSNSRNNYCENDSNSQGEDNRDNSSGEDNIDESSGGDNRDESSGGDNRDDSQGEDNGDSSSSEDNGDSSSGEDDGNSSDEDFNDSSDDDD